MTEIITSTDAAVVGMKTDGHILSWNPAAERLYGYTAEEAVGRNVSLLIPPERLGEVTANKARINGGGGAGRSRPSAGARTALTSMSQLRCPRCSTLPVR